MEMEKTGCSEEGWTVVRNKRDRKTNKLSEVSSAGDFSVCIESKSFHFSKGFGSKKGKVLIREQKGDKFASVWVSHEGISWLCSKFNESISLVWAKPIYWNLDSKFESLAASRGRNTSGEYIKLSGGTGTKSGGSIDLFFPAGRDASGWKSIVSSFLKLKQNSRMSADINSNVSFPSLQGPLSS
ncbi:hypothetical protein MKW92_021644, partial [Papaver armeniacum]